MYNSIFSGLPIIGEINTRKNDSDVLDTQTRNLNLISPMKPINVSELEAYNLNSNESIINNSSSNIEYNVIDYLNTKFSKYVFSTFNVMNTMKMLYLASRGMDEEFKNVCGFLDKQTIMDDLIVDTTHNMLSFNFLLSQSPIDTKTFSKFNRLLRFVNFNNDTITKINSYLFSKNKRLFCNFNVNFDNLQLLNFLYINPTINISSPMKSKFNKRNEIYGFYQGYIYHYQTKDLEIVEIPFNSYMLGLVKHQNMELTTEMIMNNIQHLKKERFNVQLPKFKIESIIDCNNMINNLKMNTITNNYQNMISNENKINGMIQKTIIEIEFIEIKQRLEQIRSIRFTEPFIFYVRDKKTNQLIINGKYY